MKIKIKGENYEFSYIGSRNYSLLIFYWVANWLYYQDARQPQRVLRDHVWSLCNIRACRRSRFDYLLALKEVEKATNNRGSVTFSNNICQIFKRLIKAKKEKIYELKYVNYRYRSLHTYDCSNCCLYY